MENTSATCREPAIHKACKIDHGISALEGILRRGEIQLKVCKHNK